MEGRRFEIAGAGMCIASSPDTSQSGFVPEKPEVKGSELARRQAWPLNFPSAPYQARADETQQFNTRQEHSPSYKSIDLALREEVINLICTPCLWLDLGTQLGFPSPFK